MFGRQAGLWETTDGDLARQPGPPVFSSGEARAFGQPVLGSGIEIDLLLLVISQDLISCRINGFLESRTWTVDFWKLGAEHPGGSLRYDTVPRFMFLEGRHEALPFADQIRRRVGGGDPTRQCGRDGGAHRQCLNRTIGVTARSGELPFGVPIRLGIVAQPRWFFPRDRLADLAGRRTGDVIIIGAQGKLILCHRG